VRRVQRLLARKPEQPDVTSDLLVAQAVNSGLAIEDQFQPIGETCRRQAV